MSYTYSQMDCNNGDTVTPIIDSGLTSFSANPLGMLGTKHMILDSLRIRQAKIQVMPEGLQEGTSAHHR